MRWTIRDEPQPMMDINTTPLVDVLLVLIITLILTMPLMTHAVKLDVQRGAAASNRETVNLEIAFDGAIIWNGAAVRGYVELERLCRAAAGQRVQPIVRVYADRRVKYDYVAQVLAIAQRSGVRGLGIAGGERFQD